MGFQNINKIENYQFYIDLAFKAGNRRVSGMKEKPMSKFDKVRLEEIERLNAVKKALSSNFMRIIEEFPMIDQLSEFYQELVKCTLDYVALKKSLGAMKWASEKIEDFFRIYNSRIRRCNEIKQIITYRKEFFGRVASIVKQIKKELVVLENARKVLKDFPSIKSMPTVAIAGFPNIGKTTLLSRLTKSKPDIASYPFTTKSLNIGYGEYNGNKIQFIDTPGTLNRFNKMNNIEKQATLAIKYCASAIIYIFDLTEPYPLEEQEKLFKEMKKSNKKVMIYLSKTDILDKKLVDEFSKRYDSIKDIDELKEGILAILDLDAARARQLRSSL